jgi:uncharacterized membrane protein
MIQNPGLLLLIMTATIAFAYILENTFKWAKRIGSVMIIIALGMLLSNINVIAKESPIYDITFRHLIPISISLLLLRLSIRELIKQMEDYRLIIYFALGITGTVAGAIITYYLFGNLIGPEAWKLAGQLTASYSGGGENAVAIGRTLNVSKNLFTAAFASDNIVTALWMLVCLTAPIGLSKFFTSRMPEEEIERAKEQSEPFTAHELLPSIFYSLTTAGIIVVASELLSEYVPIPSIIWVTTFSLIVAQTPLRNKFKVSYLIGSLIFNYFFFTLGAISSVSEVLKLGPPVFVFVASIVVIHAIFIFVGGKLFKADLPKLLTASQACIGGPSTACALAEANEWPHLVVPGILMGVLGYAIGNYLGWIIALLLQ